MSWVKAAAGAGRSLWRGLLLIGVGVGMLAACGRYSSRERLRVESAERWGCGKHEVTVSSVGADLVRVEGCGHSALYGCADGSRPASEEEPASGPSLQAEHRSSAGRCNVWVKK